MKNYVDIGIKEGAKLKVDGRGFKMQGYENGFYMGGCLFDDVTPRHAHLQGRDFRAGALGRAREGLSRRRSIFRTSTNTAMASRSSRATATPRAISPRKVEVGMVGINFAIPVPLAYHTFGGWKRSGFGDLNQHGPDSIRFYTKTKTVTARWPSGTKDGADFTIPTMK